MDRRRHKTRSRMKKTKAGPPKFGEYIDPIPEIVAGTFHAALGAVMGLLLGSTGQITGAWAALVVGVSAPALMTQLGRLRGIQGLVAGENQLDAENQPDTQNSQRVQ